MKAACQSCIDFTFLRSSVTPGMKSPLQELHSMELELGFCASSNPPRGMSAGIVRNSVNSTNKIQYETVSTKPPQHTLNLQGSCIAPNLLGYRSKAPLQQAPRGLPLREQGRLCSISPVALYLRSWATCLKRGKIGQG